ncbi:MAG: hypothetical protein EHM48_01745 [Planctomycetaceae bacterium]|nr:MAG: hypothetical protein EHM48_01745 [Planctomycetaceae bacterium]
MNNDRTIVAGTKQFDSRLREMLRMVDPHERQKMVLAGGHAVERFAKQNIKAHHLIDTRNLTNSVTTEPEADGSVTIGPRNVIYAAIHEFGGTITPSRARFLAIPLTEQAKKAGSPTRFSGNLHPQGMSAAGGVLIDESGTAQYALKLSVRIPARPYMRPALDEHGPEIVEQIANAIRRKIGEVTQ